MGLKGKLSGDIGGLTELRSLYVLFFSEFVYLVKAYYYNGIVRVYNIFKALLINLSCWLS